MRINELPLTTRGRRYAPPVSTTLLAILIGVAVIVGTLVLKPLESLMFLTDVSEFVFELFLSKKPADRRNAALGCLLALGIFAAVVAVIAVILWLT